MIVTNESRQDVTIAGEMAVQAFTIKASAKAFSILSANLYSNKLGAMIRELSTNAFDAHVMASKSDVPFSITLPNSMEPSFKIRDYGTGLSEDQVMNIYTTFFESTKTESNDVVGCLGLGSKSPFGVADSFTITSFYNGERTVYSAFLDANGIPSIATFFKEETTEPNGVEIEVAIKADDFSTFPREVNRQLRYFKLKPTVLGNSSFVWNPEETYLYEGTNWKMIHKGNESAKVVQGQISYPIDTSAMGEKFYNAKRAIKDIFRMSVVFEVPIGEVNIAPSREALTYDDTTIDNLLKAAEVILEEITPIIISTVETADTEWNARLLLNDSLYSISRSSDIQEHVVKDGVFWNGIDISELYIRIPVDQIISNSYYQSNRNGYKKYSRYPTSHYRNGKYSDDKYWEIKVKELDKVTFYHIAPEAKGLDGRIKQHIKDTKPYNDQHIITTSLTIDELEALLGGPKVIDSSTLAKVRREVTEKKEKNIVTIQQYTGSWNKTDLWESTDIDIADVDELEGLFVTLDRYDVVYNGSKYETFREAVNAARELNIIDKSTPIYGIRSGNKNLEHNFTCFFEYVRGADTTALTSIYSFGADSVYTWMFHNYETRAKEMLKYIAEESPMHSILKAVIHNHEHKVSHNASQFIARLKISVPAMDISDTASIATDRYTMLPKQVDYSFDVQKAVKYITAMDMLHSLTDNITDPFAEYIGE